RLGPDETAFGHRDAKYAMVIAAFWPESADDEASVQWVRDYYAAVHPYSGTEGGYINFMGTEDDARAPENFGPSYERLRRVKSVYDPDNVFHLNQNVAPAR